MAQVVAISHHFRARVKTPKHRPVRIEQIDKGIPWGFFDGASPVDQRSCGGGGVLFKSEEHFFHISAGLGRGTNNFAELMSLRLLLLFALEQGCLSLQVFGDSSLVINWANGAAQCNVLNLVAILEEIQLIKQMFNSISFTHVYRERNGVADRLSKEAAQRPLALGIWQITVHSPVGTYSYYHRPFHEEEIEQIRD